MLSVVLVVLRRYSRQDDLTVGLVSPDSARHALPYVVGRMSATIPIRVPVEGDLAFADVLQRTSAEVRAALSHSVPLERLVRALGPTAHKRDWPFEILVNWDDGLPSVDIPGVHAETVYYRAVTAKAPLCVHFYSTQDALVIDVEHDQNALPAALANHLLQNCQAVPEQAARAGSTRVCDLGLMEPADTQRLLIDINATRTPFPESLCLHEGVEAIARARGNRVAVTCGDVSLTFAELVTRAQSLADALIGQDLHAGDFVAIALNRSVDLAVAILGVMKTGSACLLLDPAFPLERKRFMVQDASVRVAVTAVDLSAEMRDLQLRTVLLDQVPAIQGTSVPGSKRSCVSTDPACVIYTSGSTGRPKGIVLSHRAAVAQMHPATSLVRMRDDDSFLVTTYHFLMPDIFWAWLAGARAVIAEEDVYRYSPSLARLIDRESVTFACFVPSMLRALLDEGRLGVASTLRTAILTGELLSEELQDRFFAAVPGASLYNGYGQAEAGATVWKCQPNVNRGFVPVGRPGPNTRIYVVDEWMKLCPLGVVGEICISSAGMADGYLNQPELTTERFLANPFDKAGFRLYRTGDFGRLTSEGVLEFLGRKDSLVKLRGHRIELDEIASVLMEHDGVREAAVVDVDTGGRKQLAAYVVASSSHEPHVGDLRNHLKRRLPMHMVPAWFSFMPEIPKTHSGKLDRSRLPAPTRHHGHPTGILKPRDVLERELVRLWNRQLNVGDVGVFDDYFELGGDSLSAAELLHAVWLDQGVEVPLGRFLDNASVAALAERVRAAKSKPLLPEIKASAPDSTAVVSVAQESAWTAIDALSGTAMFNMALALHVEGDLHIDALEHAHRAVIGRHSALRTSFRSDRGRLMASIRPDAGQPLRVIDLTWLQPSEARMLAPRVVAAESRLPFDLEKDDLLRVALVRVGEAENVLVLTMHHIATDARSSELLLADLSRSYGDAIRGSGRSDSTTKPAYTDFARWQRECLKSGALDGQLNYWLTELEHRPATHVLRGIRESPTRSFHMSRVSLSLSPSLYRDLQRVSREAKCSSYMTILAGIALLLQDAMGLDEVLISTLLDNRTTAQTQEIVGLFLNPSIIRVDLAGRPSPGDVLRRVRRQVADALDNRDVPFEVVWESLGRKWQISLSEACRVAFVLEPRVGRSLGLVGLRVRTYDKVDEASLDNGPAFLPFDLSFVARERGHRLEVTLDYRTTLYDATTMRSLLGQLRATLEGMATAVLRDA
jgi:amino acid adenylation domain-containing protein